MAYYPYAPALSDIYRLTAPSGAIAVLNDPTDPNYVGMVSEITGLDSADIRETADDLTQQDGGVHGDFWLGRRPISITGQIFGHSSKYERDVKVDRIIRASMALRGDGTLSWKPATRRENLVTNPSVEANATGYVAQTNVSVIYSTAQAAVGTGSLSMSSTAAGDIQARTADAYRIPVVPTRSYTAAVSVRSSVVRNAHARIVWRDSTGAILSESSGTAGATTTVGWTRFVVQATAPANAAYADVAVRVAATAAANELHYADAFYFEDGTRDGTYSDGNTVGWYWQGTPGASASGNYIEMFTTVRRQQPFRQSGAWNKDFQLQLVSEYATLFGVGSKTLSGNGTAENQGSYPSPPKFRITGPAGGATGTATITVVNNSVTLGVLKIGNSGAYLNLTSGQWIEIDTFTHQAVMHDGTSGNRFIDFVGTTQWPTLNTGNNTVTLAAPSGTLGTLTTTWRDTWA